MITNNIKGSFRLLNLLYRLHHHHLEEHLFHVRHKQDWGQGFILLLPQSAVLPGSDAGSDGVESALSFVI